MSTSPPISETKLADHDLGEVPSGQKLGGPTVHELRQRESYEQMRQEGGWLGHIKAIFLAKSPTIEAPLEYGGNRVAEEPSKGGIMSVLLRFARMIGPGLIIAIAYVDPDNFQSALQDGESFQYKILDMVLISVLMACYLQYLCLKLGTVTGLDLAQMNHKYMPRWLELCVYAISEACIIAADISQVIGSATAWTMLIPNLPIAAACVLPLADTLIILLFYSPTGSLRSIRYFELFIATLVMVIFVSCAVIVGQVHPAPGPVFKGYLPSRDIFVSDGLYATCAMIGGMLMPHVLYVGTSLARPRLLEYDQKYHMTTYKPSEAPIDVFYRPSLRAIKSTLRYASWELFLSIFIIGIFVNSALEIVAGAALAGTDFNDLSDLYDLFAQNINITSAKLLGVALLFSGVCAGVVSTMAGQTVMEGAFQIRINPFARRLATRCIAIVPAFIVAVSSGPKNFDSVLTDLNYLLAIGLIIIILPIIWYVSHDKYMSVPNDEGDGLVSFRINYFSIGFAWFIWLVVAVTSIATVVLVATGMSSD